MDRRRRPSRATSALAVALLLAGCTTDVDGGTGDEPAQPAATDVTERPDAASLLGDDLGGAPPVQLERRDLVVGDGEEAAAGSLLTVQYVGVAWSTGEEFDASWDRGQPFTFELGAGRVIEGWELGVEGMRVGGRRILVIPPALGYGDSGVPGAIEPGETLVFVVDLLDVDG